MNTYALALISVAAVAWEVIDCGIRSRWRRAVPGSHRRHVLNALRSVSVVAVILFDVGWAAAEHFSGHNAVAGLLVACVGLDVMEAWRWRREKDDDDWFTRTKWKLRRRLRAAFSAQHLAPGLGRAAS